MLVRRKLINAIAKKPQRASGVAMTKSYKAPSAMAPTRFRSFGTGPQFNGRRWEDRQAKWSSGFSMATAAVALSAAAWYYAQQEKEEHLADSGLKRVEIENHEAILEGQMREQAVGEGKQDKVLISRFNGQLHAIGAYCSHCGTSLEAGVLFGDKVLCPAHAAGFSVVTGVAEHAPGLDGLPRYDVVEDGKRLFVVVSEALQQKRTLPMTKRDSNDKRNFVIIGGGAAGLNCAETLRYSGYSGKITLVSNETLLPYDRTVLSKTLPFGDASKTQLRDGDWLKAADIDVVQDSIYSIHTATKQVTFARGQPMSYDKICIATGAAAKKTTIPGADAKHVYTLRTRKDQEAIKKQAAEVTQGIAIIGSSLVGSESAAALKMHYKEKFEIHLIGQESVPMEGVLGKEVGAMLLNEHQNNGIKLHMNSEVTEITKNAEGLVTGVVLANGKTLSVDMVVRGAGVAPRTELLARTECGIKKDEAGAVVCDPFLQSSQKDIFAAGDVCSFPYWQTGRPTRVEHWSHALDQGTHAAYNMLGKCVAYGNTSFYWTQHYDKSLQYVGHCQSSDEVHIDGDVAANKFVAYFIKDGKIQAVAGQGRSTDMLTMFEAFNQNKVPSPDAIKSGSVTPESLRKMLQAGTGSNCKRMANIEK